MLRVRTTVVVRGRPARRSGNTNGRDWAFWSLPILDPDYNKAEVTLDDGFDPVLFVDGMKLDLTLDVSASGNRLRLSVVEAVESKGAPVAAGASVKG